MNDKVRVAKFLNPHDATSTESANMPLLDIVTAAHRLGCSERFVRRLVQERRIPYVKLGGTKVRFIETDLNQWIANKRVNAMR